MSEINIKKKIEKILKKNIVLIILMIIFLVLCLFIKYNYINYVNKIDKEVNILIRNNLINNSFTSIMKIITNIASLYSILLIFIITIILLKNKISKITLLFNIIIISISTFFLKLLFLRERPLNSTIKTPSSYSFPSGHTFFAVGFLGLIAYLLLKSNLSKYIKYILVFIMVSIIILIGFSRIYLGVHHFTDVIGGMIFGIIILLISINIYKALEEES